MINSINIITALIIIKLWEILTAYALVHNHMKSDKQTLAGKFLRLYIRDHSNIT